MSTPSEPTLRLAQLRFDIASDRYAEAVCDTLGINRSHLRCLRALSLEGPLTAGALSEKCGLTTGAVTGILDRMERLGLVQREADPFDRRRVMAQLHSAKQATLEKLLLPGGTGDSSQSLAILLAARADLLDAATEQVRAGSPQAEPLAESDGFLWAPLDGRERGTFEVIGGAMRVDVDSAAPEGELFRATLDDKSLRMSERDGHVRLEHRSRWTRGRPEAVVHLNPAVDWSIRMSGGANDANFQVSRLPLREIEIKGGSSRVLFDVGELPDRVPVRVTGGANKLSVQRLPATAVTVAARGMATIDCDGEHHRMMGGGTWQSGGGPGGLDFIVKGGANVIRVDGGGTKSF